MGAIKRCDKRGVLATLNGKCMFIDRVNNLLDIDTGTSRSLI